MAGVYQAMKEWFEGDPALHPAVDGPWLFTAPPRRAYPYALILDRGDKIAMFFGGDYIEGGEKQVSLFHTDLDALMGLHRAVIDRFHGAVLPVTDGTLLQCQLRLPLTRKAVDLGGKPARSPDGLEVYQSVNLFRIEVEHAVAE
jgi:hypothetical protein